MRFGNWNVKEEMIEWVGEDAAKIVIEKEQLLETSPVADRKDALYKSLLNATVQHALGEDDLYDLNFAFVYAAGSWGKEMSYEVFDQTVAYQFEILEEGEEEDDEDDY